MSYFQSNAANFQQKMTQQGSEPRFCQHLSLLLGLFNEINVSLEDYGML